MQFRNESELKTNLFEKRAKNICKCPKGGITLFLLEQLASHFCNPSLRYAENDVLISAPLFILSNFTLLLVFINQH